MPALSALLRARPDTVLFDLLEESGRTVQHASLLLCDLEGASSRGGKKSNSSASSTKSSPKQGGTTQQKKAAGRKGGKATAKKS